MNQNYRNPITAVYNPIFIMTLQATVCFMVLITLYSYLNSVYFSYPNPLANIPKWLILQHESRKTPYLDSKHNQNNDVEAILSINESVATTKWSLCRFIQNSIKKSNTVEKEELINSYVDYLQYEIRKLKTELLANIAIVDTPSDTTTLTSISPSRTDDSMEYLDAMEGKISQASNTSSVKMTPPKILQHEHSTVSYNPEPSQSSIKSPGEAYSPSNSSMASTSNPLLDNIANQVENMLEDFNSINECVESNIFHTQEQYQNQSSENEEDMP